MRCLARNQQTIQYRTYSAKTKQYDSNGNFTGEYVNTYSSPISIEASVSTATGKIAEEVFGTLEGYDKVIVTDDIDLPINENTVFNIDTLATQSTDKWDYTVVRIAKSLNSMSIAVQKVKVS